MPGSVLGARQMIHKTYRVTILVGESNKQIYIQYRGISFLPCQGDLNYPFIL